MLDVIIAGGGIAGSSLAIFLGSAGFEVEVYERAHFPREKPCGEGLMPAGVAVLERLGLATRMCGAPFCGVRYHFGARTVEGRFPQAAGLPATGRGFRRKHLDNALLQTAANTPGVRVTTGARVDGPLIENGRVAGLVVCGEARRAQLTVAADGAHSRMRHALGLDVPSMRKRIGVRAHFRLAAGQVQSEWVDAYACRGYELYVTPLADRELLVAGLAPAEAVTGPLEFLFENWCRGQAHLAKRLEGAEQITPLACVSPLSGHSRRGVAPGVVLLGDAAGFLDPITGGGMTQALITAELLAAIVATERAISDARLKAFDRERRRMLRDYRALTKTVLWLSEHPRLTERALAVLGQSPRVFSHLIGVCGGMKSLLALGEKRRKIALRLGMQGSGLSTAPSCDAD